MGLRSTLRSGLRVARPLRGKSAGGGGGGGSTLLDGLIAFWKLADLTDASGNGYTLTNNNSVTFNTGKIGNASYHTRASNQYLSIANASAGGLYPAGDMSFQCWVKFDSTTTGIYSFVSQANSWSLLRQPAGGNNLFVASISSATGNGIATSLFTIDTSSWWHLVATYRSSDGQVDLWVNGVKTGTDNAGTGGALASTSNDFNLGTTANASGANHDGPLDAVGVWHRALTDEEITALYNSGSGLEHPFAA